MIRREWRFAMGTALVSWLVLACTAPGIPIVWDEGDYLQRADQIVEWFRHPAFSKAAIEQHWLFITYAEGHPAWFAIPIAFSKLLLGGVLDPLTAARLGPITVFSLACGAVAFRLRKSDGVVAALVAPIALLTFPRMFSEAHFATQDAQLTAWWLMLWAADTSTASGTRQAAGVGVLLGLTSATKFTGWIPLVVSRALRKDAAQRRALLLIVPLALLTYFVVNPPLWHDPLRGLATHFRLSLNRSQTYSIATMFLGRIYDMQHSLPWYNTLAWLVFATPVPTLLLGAIGVVHGLRARSAFSIALLAHWATLMVVRALPGSPPHDGIRLFLPAFGFWCVLAGIGAQRVWNASTPWTAWRRPLVRVTVAAALAATAGNLTRYYPQTLSHYSLLVGGVRGAASLGMEPAYWWDALDRDVLTWINEHTDPADGVAFSPTSNMTQLHEWKRLRVRDIDPQKDVFTWYVLQNRPGMFNDRDRALVARAKPAYVKYAGRHPAENGVPSDLDVPLILIFSYDQYQQAGR
jgi:hypothetical protein